METPKAGGDWISEGPWPRSPGRAAGLPSHLSAGSEFGRRASSPGHGNATPSGGGRCNCSSPGDILPCRSPSAAPSARFRRGRPAPPARWGGPWVGTATARGRSPASGPRVSGSSSPAPCAPRSSPTSQKRPRLCLDLRTLPFGLGGPLLTLPLSFPGLQVCPLGFLRVGTGSQDEAEPGRVSPRGARARSPTGKCGRGSFGTLGAGDAS